MLKKIISFVLTVSVCAWICPVYACSEEESGYTRCAVLAEASTGTILEEHNGSVRVPVGVMSKLMTVLLASEAESAGEISPDDEVTAGASVNNVNGALIWLSPGDKITFSELMKGIITGNANDAAVTAAERLGGTQEKFVEMMNLKAKALGMNDTSFKSCHGYDDSGNQISTAEDMSLLVCELGKYSCYDEMFLCKVDHIRSGEAMLVNSNRLAGKFDGLKGYKAGYTEASGYCGAFLAQRDGRSYAAVLLGYEDEDKMFADARKLLERGFGSYRLFSPELPEDIPFRINVRGGNADSVRIACDEAEEIIIRTGEADEITCVTALPEYIYAPVRKGDKVGEVLYYKKGSCVSRVDITAEESSDEINLLSIVVVLIKKIIGF